MKQELNTRAVHYRFTWGCTLASRDHGMNDALRGGVWEERGAGASACLGTSGTVKVCSSISPPWLHGPRGVWLPRQDRESMRTSKRLHHRSNWRRIFLCFGRPRALWPTQCRYPNSPTTSYTTQWLPYLTLCTATHIDSHTGDVCKGVVISRSDGQAKCSRLTLVHPTHLRRWGLRCSLPCTLHFVELSPFASAGTLSCCLFGPHRVPLSSICLCECWWLDCVGGAWSVLLVLRWREFVLAGCLLSWAMACVSPPLCPVLFLDKEWWW
jgi:hypothetical protein